MLSKATSKTVHLSHAKGLPRAGWNRRVLMKGALASAAASLGLDALAQAEGKQRFITIVSTHTTQDSGLLSHLGPVFTARTGITLRFVIFGSGQALDTGRRGDADVVLSHFRSEEERFVADGFGLHRRAVMYNDFVLIGPQGDPAGVAAESDPPKALAKIRSREALFISRGDRSGTHAAELALWRQAGINIEHSHGSWYRQIGQGMGAALNMAASVGAYTLSDRGTWLNFRNRGELSVLLQSSPALRNQYGVILVNPERHPHVKVADGQAFIDWLTGPDGQKTISDYKIGGEQLFFPNAAEPGA